jgi:Lyase
MLSGLLSRSGGVVMATVAKKGLRKLPIATGATGTGVESDSMGEIEVPAEHYWGAQTERSLLHSIGDDRMPKAVYHAYGYVNKAAALVNAKAGRLDGTLAEAIVAAADEVIAGKLDSEFPLYLWQTGSGTQCTGCLLPSSRRVGPPCARPTAAVRRRRQARGRRRRRAG